MTLDVFLLSDQPTTCPRCGARTEWDDRDDGTQHHRCPRCTFEFIAEEDDEVEPEEYSTITARRFDGVELTWYFGLRDEYAIALEFARLLPSMTVVAVGTAYEVPEDDFDSDSCEFMAWAEGEG